MADLSKLKARRRLGDPPAATDVVGNLKAPETAPAALRRPDDGRSARKTGRTVQFATRVSADFDRRFRATCKRDKLLMVELLERALDAYEQARRG